jgi:thiol:disulfide interchange protein DsbC
MKPYTHKFSHKLATLCFSALMAFTLSIDGAQAQSSDASASPEARLLETLKRAHPSTRFNSVQATPIPGVYEVVMGQNIAYVSETGRYFLIGRLIDMVDKTDITASTKERIAQRVEWKDLPLKDAIKFGSGALQLAVFSDPDCPFCRQLEAELDKLEGVTVYVFPYPIASLHPSAAKTAANIWCAPNRAQAWRNYLIRKTPPPAAKAGCDASAIERNVALADSLSINATPTLISGDGRIASGMSPAATILAWLQRGAQQ